MYQGVREQVRNICLSSIHTRLLITYCPASTPRWIAGRHVRDVLRPRCYFIIGTVHRREDVHQERNNVILNVVFRYTRFVTCEITTKTILYFVRGSYVRVPFQRVTRRLIIPWICKARDFVMFPPFDVVENARDETVPIPLPSK